ncbi:MAG: hypothetical protein RL593_844, partial [Pseudomonadota bacterium]
GIAGHFGALTLNSEMLWLTNSWTLTLLGLASLFEITAYYIPWVDNLLDSITTPTAVIAGTLLTSSMLTEYDPAVKWSLGLIAGGGAAGGVQGSTVAIRASSTALTGGLGNFIVATIEWILAALIIYLAIIFPLLAILVLGAILYGTFLIIQKLRMKIKLRKRKSLY